MKALKENSSLRLSDNFEYLLAKDYEIFIASFWKDESSKYQSAVDNWMKRLNE
jgi:hypothetical protein